jgi:hypothetical protein
MKVYVGVDIHLHIFLISALVVGEWSASSISLITLRERGPGTLWIGGRVDLRPGLDDVEERKFLTLLGLEIRRPSYSFLFRGRRLATSLMPQYLKIINREMNKST